MKILASALLIAVTVSSPAVVVDLRFSSSVELNDSLFLYKSTAPGLNDQNGHPLGSLAAGNHFATAQVDGNLGQYDYYRYSLLATYVSDGHNGVVVALNSAASALAAGHSFESTFGATESSIFDAIHGIYSGDYATLLASVTTLFAFQDANLDKFPLGRADGTLMAFSDGAPVGEIHAQPVPEPTSMAALGVGALGFLKRRKKA